ncbi:MAG: hypothetical protein PHQ89_05630 [Bacilli bacterium]|nr:hypothetical protein [Bacilli bacterium]
MAKNNEQKIKDDLNDLLGRNEAFEYVLYGKLAPKTKRIIIIFGVWLLLVCLLLFNVLTIDIYLLPVVLVLFILSGLAFYNTVYLAKFGKHVYIHEFDRLKLKNQKEKLIIKNIDVVEDRTSDFHLTILAKFNNQEHFIIFKRNSENKGYPNQATNMKQLILNIKKKHKK